MNKQAHTAKIAALEARIAALESRLEKVAAANWSRAAIPAFKQAQKALTDIPKQLWEYIKKDYTPEYGFHPEEDIGRGLRAVDEAFWLSLSRTYLVKKKEKAIDEAITDVLDFYERHNYLAMRG